jgi:CheY-like chemotaxis protein
MNRQLRILLVEDDPIHAMVIRHALQGHDALGELVHVDDGEAAVKLLHQPTPDSSPDLVLLDIRLPGIDGFDVLRQLRASEKTRPLPVVMVSTSDDPAEISRSYAMGANAFIVKSPDYEDFSRRLSDVQSFWSKTAELPTVG